MRLWTLHPKYLDRQGLLALWREALLAQKVLRGETVGYRRHPELRRFQELGDPLAGIGSYLDEVLAEAKRRGYRFDGGKIGPRRLSGKMDVSRRQLSFELAHLRGKLAVRDPVAYGRLAAAVHPDPHPLFKVVGGEERQEP